MDLLNEFTNIVKSLEDNSVEYATCGGLAMAVHGFVRATKDIDILIRPDAVEPAFRVAREHGYDIEGLPLNFRDEGMKLRRISKIDPASKTLVTVDFLLVTEVMEDVWNGRELVEWESGHAWVVSRKGLIKMKTLAGRDQDLVDIKRLKEETDDES